MAAVQKWSANLLNRRVNSQGPLSIWRYPRNRRTNIVQCDPLMPELRNFQPPGGPFPSSACRTADFFARKGRVALPRKPSKSAIPAEGWQYVILHRYRPGIV